MVFGSHHLFQLFSQDQVLIQAAADIAGIVFIGFMTVGIGMICPALFQALGFAGSAIILNTLHNYILLLPILWSLSALYGVSGIWWSFPAIDAISAFIIAVYTGYFIKKLAR
jgi:Na+-driven multidrug efflux pump